MKVVIIGGGIAGLSMGIYLFKNGIDVSINERKLGVLGGGHAFLMHHDGLSILKELTDGTDCMLPGKAVSSFVLKRPDGTVVDALSLDEWQCFKRTDLTNCLVGLLPDEIINDGRAFSKFIYKDGKIVAAKFLDGSLEYGDLFIGADGANSLVRQAIMGEVKFEPGIVKEVVGIVDYPELAQRYTGQFTKFQSKEKGLAVGLISTSATELVWFMQYDPALGDITDRSPGKLKEFCKSMLRDFPAEITAIMERNDFNTSYIWNTRDFDLINSFHHDNVALIGDAAHLALPFTSAGTTNAIIDAKILTACLIADPDYTVAFESYYSQRSVLVAKHVLLGRELRASFLNPEIPGFTVPLIIDLNKE